MSVKLIGATSNAEQDVNATKQAAVVFLVPSDLVQIQFPAANIGATITLPAVSGQFHYITSIIIGRSATAALSGTATLSITTTNLPSSLQWRVGNAMVAGGTQRDVEMYWDNPLKSSVANTNTTIVLPAPGAAVLWGAVVTYFTAA